MKFFGAGIWKNLLAANFEINCNFVAVFQLVLVIGNITADQRPLYPGNNFDGSFFAN